MKNQRNFLEFFKENWLFFAIILYVLSPVDLIPDILPGIGTADDALLVLIRLLLEYGKYKKGETEKS